MNLLYRKNINDNYNLKKLDKCLELVNKNIKFPLSSGIQGNTYKIHSELCGSVVLKEFFLQNEKNDVRKSTNLEYRVLTLLKKMINKFVCPNFIEIYYYDSKKPYILMEYADGDCRFLFKDDFYETEIYEIFICQILIGLLCLHTQTILYHRDLKPANLLYKNINKNIVFHYKINNEDYYIPTKGYLFMIADFGRANLELGFFSEEKNLATQIEIYHMQFLEKKFQTMEKFLELFSNEEQTELKKIYIKEHSKLEKVIQYAIEKKLLKNKLSVNEYIYKMYGMLVSKIPIQEIINKYFSKFKSKGDYKDENIVNFTFNY
jgi:serine/threonine protein kinase